jgi:hypothetical protein
VQGEYGLRYVLCPYCVRVALSCKVEMGRDEMTRWILACVGNSLVNLRYITSANPRFLDQPVRSTANIVSARGN